MKKQVKKQDWSKLQKFKIEKKAQQKIKGGEASTVNTIIVDDINHI